MPVSVESAKNASTGRTTLAVRDNNPKNGSTKTSTALVTVIAMPTGIVPLSVRLAEFHESQRDWHREMARKHRDHGHERAEQDHLEAAAVHEAAMAKPLDERLARAARRASGLAARASQKVGVRPFKPWPKR